MSTVDMFSILVGVICCVVLEVGGQEASNNSVPQGAPMSPPACPCAKAAWCKPVKIQGKGKPQLMVYSLYNSTWSSWPWKNIGTVLAVDRHDPELMCHAHSMGAKYGLLVTKMHFPKFGVSHDIHQWMDSEVKAISYQHQDLVVLDIDDMFGTYGILDLRAKVDFARDVVIAVKSRLPYIQVGIHHKLEYSRFETHCDHLRQLAIEMDFIFIVPVDSGQSQMSNILALDTSQSPPKIQCMATPPNSYISTMRTIEQYTGCGISVEQLVLYVGWQGRDFLCHKFHVHNDTCFISGCPAGNVLDLGQVMFFKDKNAAKRNWNYTFKTPFFNYFADDIGMWHQIWYEDEQSLQFKYTLVESINLAGLAVWHGDAVTFTSAYSSLAKEVWQEVIGWSKLRDDKPPKDWGSVTGEMTGLAIILFLLGIALGGATVYCGMKARIRRMRFHHIHVDEEREVSTDLQ